MTMRTPIALMRASRNARPNEFLRKHGEVRIAEFRQRYLPHRPLVPSLRMKGLIPPPLVQIRVTRILPLLGRRTASVEMLSTTPHFRPIGKCDVGLANGIRVVDVIRLQREKEKVLVVGRRSILHARWHRIRLVPNDVRSEDPASVL